MFFADGVGASFRAWVDQGSWWVEARHQSSRVTIKRRSNLEEVLVLLPSRFHPAAIKADKQRLADLAGPYRMKRPPMQTGQS